MSENVDEILMDVSNSGSLLSSLIFKDMWSRNEILPVCYSFKMCLPAVLKQQLQT